MLNLDLLRLLDQLQKFFRKERGTWTTLAIILIGAWTLWSAGLGTVLPDFTGEHGTRGFWILAAAGTAWWLWSRRIPLGKGRLTIGIAPFKVISINKTLSGDEHYDLSQEVTEHIYTTLHRIRERLGLTDFIHFVRLPERVSPDFETARAVCEGVGTDILVWGAVRIETHGDEEKKMLEPQFNFLREPASSFYRHFRKSLNQLHQFPVDFDRDDDASATLFLYVLLVAMLFAGLREAAARNFEKAGAIFARGLEEARSRAKTNPTITDILISLEFFAARTLHLWGNALLAGGDETGAAEKFTEAERLLMTRAGKIASAVGKPGELEKLEHTYLYGVYLLAKSGRVREAEAKLRAIAGKIPEAEFTLNLAKIYKFLDPEQAETLFAEAIRKADDPHVSNEAREELGFFYAERGNFKKAAEMLDAKLTEDERKPYEPELYDDEGRAELASAYFAQHRWISAERAALQAALDTRRNRDDRKMPI